MKNAPFFTTEDKKTERKEEQPVPGNAVQHVIWEFSIS